ncbi:hypothetical protein LAZ67_6000439 [Cordylochernes scorpioides]|uniref:Transposase n=1 Tax=Cordylochernes scorpioides TaxID=51811 RepID=A0ABY6KLJ6_9ARAC|nr:hypothetical protein LAZ67_6000439 [Cordylochernes scorpioides]
MNETGIPYIPFKHIPEKSPDLAPMDFCAFGLLKTALRSINQKTLDGLWKVVKDCLDGLDQNISRRSLISWKHRCRAVAEVFPSCLSAQEWHSDIFSDESKFSLGVHDDRIHVRRSPHEGSNQDCIVEGHTARIPGFMVCDGIIYKSRIPLFFIQATMNVQLYIADVLQPVVLPFLELTMRFSNKIMPDHKEPTYYKPFFKMLTSLPGPHVPQIFPQLSMYET